MKIKLHVNIAITCVCVILGIMISTQFKSIDFNNKVTSYENKRASDLRDELINEKRIKEELQKKVSSLEEEIKGYVGERGKADETGRILTDKINEARKIAGLTDVKGKGVIITIDNNDFVTVEDTDLLSLINELKAADAQAISVNDERIVAMSEVRMAGKYIMINGRQMLAPFTIKAIADPDKIEHSLKMVNGVVDKLKSYQLKVTVEKSDNIIIPKVRDDGTVIKTDLLTPVYNN